MSIRRKPGPKKVAERALDRLAQQIHIPPISLDVNVPHPFTNGGVEGQRFGDELHSRYVNGSHYELANELESMAKTIRGRAARRIRSASIFVLLSYTSKADDLALLEPEPAKKAKR